MELLVADGLQDRCPTKPVEPRAGVSNIRPAGQSQARQGIYPARQLMPSPSSKYLSKQRWADISLKCQSSHSTVYTAIIQHD